MSSIRLSGTTSGHYDLTVPAAAGTNSIDLSKLPVKGTNNDIVLDKASNPALSGTTNRNTILNLRNTDTGYVAGNATAIDFGTSLFSATSSIIGRNHQSGAGYGGDLLFATSPASSNSLTERMRINSNGQVTTPNQPSFLMKKYSGGSTAISVNSVWTFDEALTNIGGHANISNGRFTAPVAGNYCFMWHNIGEGTSTVYRSFIRKNASGSWGTGSYRLESRNFHSGGYPNASAQVVIPLSASDYVDIYLEGGSIYSDTTNGVWFCGFLIG